MHKYLSLVGASSLDATNNRMPKPFSEGPNSRIASEAPKGRDARGLGRIASVEAAPRSHRATSVINRTNRKRPPGTRRRKRNGSGSSLSGNRFKIRVE